MGLVGNGWASLENRGRPGESREALLSLYRGMMASVALALVAGGIVERIRFSFFLVFGLCWVAAVYVPLGAVVMGRERVADEARKPGLRRRRRDPHQRRRQRAGDGDPIGPRKGYGRIRHDAEPSAVLLLRGRVHVGGLVRLHRRLRIGVDGGVTNAFVAIQLSAVAATLAWMTVEWLQRDRPTALGAMSGAVAGLVAIAPAAGYVSPLSSIVIGVGAGGLCYMVVNYVKVILGYDDSLDVFGMHGVGGTWGMIATGLFASTEVNAEGATDCSTDIRISSLPRWWPRLPHGSLPAG